MVATALKGVIEKASPTFPNAQVVISTLLLRKEFHPATIQRKNASISRDWLQNQKFTCPSWT
jgi:hypothetical protein